MLGGRRGVPDTHQLLDQHWLFFLITLVSNHLLCQTRFEVTGYERCSSLLPRSASHRQRALALFVDPTCPTVFVVLGLDSYTWTHTNTC